GGFLVADQHRRFRRLRHALQGVMLLGCEALEYHCASLRLPAASACASSPRNTASVTASSTSSGEDAASITTQRSGSASAMARNASLRRLCISTVSFSKRSGASPEERRASARLRPS